MLVADLKSPAMARYINNYNLNTIGEIFDTYYQRVTNFELDRLKDALLQGYNNFVRLNPYHKDILVCEINPSNTVHRVQERQMTNIDLVNGTLDTIKLYRMYTRIRNVEEGSPFKKPDIARILQKMSFFYRRLGPMRALEYVNEQYRSLYKFKQGSVEDIRRRLQKKKELQEEEEVREDLGTGTASSAGSSMPGTGGGY